MNPIEYTDGATSQLSGKARAAYYINGITSVANTALALAFCAGALVCVTGGAYLLSAAFMMGTLTQGALAYHSYNTFQHRNMLKQRPLEAARTAATDLRRGLMCASLTPLMLVFNLSAALPAALIDVAARALPDISQSSTQPSGPDQDKDQSEWKRLPLPAPPPSVMGHPPLRLRTSLPLLQPSALRPHTI